MKKKIKLVNSKKPKSLDNSIGVGGYEGIGPGNYPLSGTFDSMGGNAAPNSLPFEISHNLSYNLVSLQRMILTYAYVEFGVFRTLCEQPVKDALKGGVRIKSAEVDEEDIESLERELKKIKFWRKICSAMTWARLFGGAGIITNVSEDFSKPFDVSKVTSSTKLNFLVADRWELAYNGTPNDPTTTFLYYGQKLHPSRVAKVLGKEAPSMARSRLQGWAMSEIESIIRELGSNLKHENVGFEYLDEFKVDVWKIKGFNSQHLNKAAAGQLTSRFRLANMMKNFLNAIVLDKEDDFEHKQPTISGLAEIMDQLMVRMAAAARMPMSKIYGLSAKGFASGEDDLENYAGLIEGVRDDIVEILDTVMPIVCMREWGLVPDDLSYEFEPARTLTAESQENVLNAKYTRTIGLYDRGFYNPQEACEELKRAGIMTVKTKVSDGAEPEPPMMSMLSEEGGGDEEGGKKKSAKASKEKESQG